MAAALTIVILRAMFMSIASIFVYLIYTYSLAPTPAGTLLQALALFKSEGLEVET
jgi:hypothetical protein